MKITALNLDIVWKNKTQNFNSIESKLQHIDADLILLPEMFSTGFCMEAEDIADQNNESLIWMQNWAKKKNCAIAGSVSVLENHNFYNRFYFVMPDGSYDFYNKRHLFSYAGENKIYTAGKERKIIQYKGIRFLLQICYDLRFPVFSRNNGDYDVALYLANWPEPRVEAWNHLLKARAIENLSYVFGVNRIGKDGNHLNYQESTNCFFADGSLVSKKFTHHVSTEIHMEQLENFRKKFGFLNDRDRFSIDY